MTVLHVVNNYPATGSSNKRGISPKTPTNINIGSLLSFGSHQSFFSFVAPQSLQQKIYIELALQPLMPMRDGGAREGPAARSESFVANLLNEIYASVCVFFRGFYFPFHNSQLITTMSLERAAGVASIEGEFFK